MGNVPLLHADDSVLLIVDMQTRLAGSMPAADWARARDGAIVLIRAATAIGLPILVTRQYPKGLGETDPDIEAALPAHAERLDKTCFSACGAAGFLEVLEMTGRSHIVVCGMETHVCVLQTVADLAARDHRPCVVGDAVCSRDPAHTANALERMRAGGIPVTNRESAMFEWLRDARHEQFKTVSKLLK